MAANGMPVPHSSGSFPPAHRSPHENRSNRRRGPRLPAGFEPTCSPRWDVPGRPLALTGHRTRRHTVHRTLIVAKLRPDRTDDIAKIFGESDATDLPHMIGVSRRAL